MYKENPHAQPDLAQYPYVLQRQLKPEARKDILSLFKEIGIQPTSMIDISDGLSSEVLHLCKSSGTGAKIFEEKIPLDPEVIRVCEEFNVDSTTLAINGGEDYELLFTLPLDKYEKIKGNPHFTVVGHMTEENEGIHLVTRDGQMTELIARGWNAISEDE